MKTSKIHKDEVDWLISIYKTSEIEELKNESFEKLMNFGLNENQINERFHNLKSEEAESKAFEKAWEIQKRKNQFERYTIIEKIKIFFFGPYLLFKSFNSGLIDLKKDNYKIKFNQKLILLISGTIFWILLFIAFYQFDEYRRIKEIEKTDITNWEENRITH